MGREGRGVGLESRWPSVAVIATVLDHDGPITDCPPQTIEAALLRMWSRTCWGSTRAITRTTIDQEGAPSRCRDLAGTLGTHDACRRRQRAS